MEFTKLAFIDLETTGLEPILSMNGFLVAPWHEIIEIGCVIADMKNPSKAIDELSFKVLPEHPERITSGAQEINGYNEKDWKNALPLEEAMRRLIDFVSGSVLFAGNISFDWVFLQIALAKSGYTKEKIDETLYYSKRESSSFAAGRLFVPQTPVTLEMFSGRTIEKQLGLESEPKPHRAINGARQIHSIFSRAWARKT